MEGGVNFITHFDKEGRDVIRLRGHKGEVGFWRLANICKLLEGIHCNLLLLEVEKLEALKTKAKEEKERNYFPRVYFMLL
ncbi:hypothetical protein HPP92_002910 [Vanilla planifolia]|uniref:Uncharacterized protein n=1 Tax=Vanilla planifolia TaxID=51239 RepID=A0A835VMY0_VANPL|nr:hypothetical protein HPP92_002910 [Vanilla planifolia]